MSSKDTDEERVMHSVSDNIEVIVNDKLLSNFLKHFFLDIK